MTPAVLAPLRAALALERPPPSRQSGVAAAVLVPLFERDGALHLLYTTRSAALPHHPGQISFPGGRHVPDADGTLLATALRESEEEIGLAPGDVDVLGVLDPIYTFSSNFLITPFVAQIPHPYPFIPSPHEVDDIFSIPLAALGDPANVVEETWTMGDHALPVVSYRHEGRIIWGATQRITTALLDLVLAISADQD